jgi:hypothetical protein
MGIHVVDPECSAVGNQVCMLLDAAIELLWVAAGANVLAGCCWQFGSRHRRL